MKCVKLLAIWICLYKIENKLDAISISAMPKLNVCTYSCMLNFCPNEKPLKGRLHWIGAYNAYKRMKWAAFESSFCHSFNASFRAIFFCTYATVCYIHRMGYNWWNSNHARHFCRNFAKIWTIKSHSWKMHWKFCWATPMRQHSLPFRILTNSPKWRNDSKNAIIH